MAVETMLTAERYVRHMLDEVARARRGYTERGGQHVPNVSPYARMPLSALGALERDLREVLRLLGGEG